MSLAAAKRRYKILLREQGRLKERNAVDDDIDRELARLRADHPDLVEVQSTISAATASMLAFAESMTEPEATSTKPSPTTLSTIQSAGLPEAAAAAVPENDAPSHSSPPSITTATNSQPADHTAHRTLQFLTALMLLVAPYIAHSRTSRGLCALVVFASIVIPVTHRAEPAIAAPCNSVRYYASSSSPASSSSALRHAYFVLFDPIAVTLMAHLIYFAVVCRGKHLGAYIVKDLIPAVVTSFVLYSATNMVLNLATDLRPVRTFC
jgi:hypothetical protein